MASMVSSGYNFFSSPRTVFSSVLLLGSPSLGKYVFKEQYDQKWKWSVSILALGIATLSIGRDKKMPLGKSCLISLALSSIGHAITYYAFPQPTSKRESIGRDPIHTAPSVLSAILPKGDLDSGKDLFYYYIATHQGFSLIFYNVDLKDLRLSFTHGCDPMGSFAHPMIADVRWRKVPPDIYELIVGKMRAAKGCPPILALQGRWTVSDRELSEEEVGLKMKNLLSSEQLHAFEQYPDFDLQILRGSWKEMPQNPDLKGISFEFFDQNLEIWMHESNDSALPSALRMAERELRNLQIRIDEQGKLIKNGQSFLDGELNSRTFLSKLPAIRKTSHSKEQIQAVHRKDRESAPFEDQVRIIIQNAELYLQSLNEMKRRTDHVLGELEAYKRKSEELAAALDPSEIARLNSELSCMPCPTSYLLPTIQIKQAHPIDERVLKHLMRNNLLETVNLFNFIQHRRLISSFDTEEVQNVLRDGYILLQQKAKWIMCQPDSRIIVERIGFERDLKTQQEKAANPTWSEVEWLLNKFAQYEGNFQMMRTFPFTDEDIQWYGDTRSTLLNLLEKSGQMTVELEEQISRLSNQYNILSEDQELYLIKRLSRTGHFLSEVTKRRDRDPLANLDGVHIPI